MRSRSFLIQSKGGRMDGFHVYMYIGLLIDIDQYLYI